MCTVYLVEDNSADVELFRLALDTADVECALQVFADGREIIDHICQQSPPVPDLIILDLNLPKLDGLEVLRLIRATPGFAKIPVAALSSSPSPRDQQKLSELDVAAYLVKPSDLDEYMKIGTAVRNLLS